MTRMALNASGAALVAAGAPNETGQSAQAEDVSIYWYEQGIPNSVAVDMERLYENFFSSFGKFSASREADSACAYVVRHGGEAATIFLFRIVGPRIHVLNEFIAIDGEEIQRFAKDAFLRYPTVGAVSFRAVQSAMDALPFPFQRHNCIEDIVLTLPSTVEEYDKLLGKNMRKNIRTHLDRIKRAYPSFEYTIHATDETDERHIRSIIRFNRQRTIGKSKRPGIDSAEADRIVDMVKACGMVATVMIDGEICAGKLFFQVGRNFYSLLNAHSPEFNPFRLGTLCNYLSICECIRRGGREYHFLWGREEFKYRFLGEQRDFDELVIYRSRLHMALNGGLALKTAIDGKKRQARLWLLDPKRKDQPVIRFAKSALRRLRVNSLGGTHEE